MATNTHSQIKLLKIVMYYHFKNHCPLMRRGLCDSRLTVRLTSIGLAECHWHFYLVYFSTPTLEKWEYNKIEALQIFVKLFICFLLSPTETISFQLPNRSPNALAIENSLNKKLWKPWRDLQFGVPVFVKLPTIPPLKSASTQHNDVSGDKQTKRLCRCKYWLLRYPRQGDYCSI